MPTRKLTQGRQSTDAEPHSVVTGGAGFIGSNLTDRLLQQGHRVTIVDNLSRCGAEINLRWLQDRHPERLTFHLVDIRDSEAVSAAIGEANHVYHLAAQVAVTTSLANPRKDFEINAHGTLNVLEAVRTARLPPTLLYASTNKVYGDLAQVQLKQNGLRYAPVDGSISQQGISEDTPLDLFSPYGCSKGAADQYVRDYARMFDLRAVVFRMSCIYGPRQFGTEDQGWVTHFVRQALRGLPLQVYGDGLQVRDMLYVDDLVDAMILATDQMTSLRGQVFNIGGGPNNAMSIRELLEQLRSAFHLHVDHCYRTWRPGDQRYYVSGCARFQQATGWHPRTTPAQGLHTLLDWVRHSCDEGILPHSLSG